MIGQSDKIDLFYLTGSTNCGLRQDIIAYLIMSILSYSSVGPQGFSHPRCEVSCL